MTTVYAKPLNDYVELTGLVQMIMGIPHHHAMHKEKAVWLAEHEFIQAQVQKEDEWLARKLRHCDDLNVSAK